MSDSCLLKVKLQWGSNDSFLTWWGLLEMKCPVTRLLPIQTLWMTEFTCLPSVVAASLRDSFQRQNWTLWCSVTVRMLNVPLYKWMCLNSYSTVAGGVALGGCGTNRWCNLTGGGKSLGKSFKSLELYLPSCSLSAFPSTKLWSEQSQLHTPTILQLPTQCLSITYFRWSKSGWHLLL